MALGNFPQTATYWAVTGNDGYGGKSFSSPASLEVRWEDIEEKYIDSHGEEFVSRSKIFVQQDVTIGSYLYLGTSAESSPYDVSGAGEIKTFKKVPTLDADEYERKAIL